MAKSGNSTPSSMSESGSGSDSGSGSGSGSSSGSSSGSGSGSDSGSDSDSGSSSGSDDDREQPPQQAGSGEDGSGADDDGDEGEMSADPRAGGARSVLPRAYELPAGFEPAPAEEEVLDASAVEGKELWLFRVPKSLDPATLSGATLELPPRSNASLKVGDAFGTFSAGGNRRCTIRAAANAELDTTVGLLYSRQREELVLAQPFHRNFEVVAPLSEPLGGGGGGGGGDEPAPFALRPVPIFSCYQAPPQRLGMSVRYRPAGAGTTTTLPELSAARVVAPAAAGGDASGDSAKKKQKKKKRALAEVEEGGEQSSKKKKPKSEKKDKKPKKIKKSA